MNIFKRILIYNKKIFLYIKEQNMNYTFFIFVISIINILIIHFTIKIYISSIKQDLELNKFIEVPVVQVVPEELIKVKAQVSGEFDDFLKRNNKNIINVETEIETENNDDKTFESLQNDLLNYVNQSQKINEKFNNLENNEEIKANNHYSVETDINNYYKLNKNDENTHFINKEGFNKKEKIERVNNKEKNNKDSTLFFGTVTAFDNSFGNYRGSLIQTENLWKMDLK